MCKQDLLYPILGQYSYNLQGHGTLNAIYDSIEKTCTIHQFKVDLLIICGDFQAVRNGRDLNCMAVPPKYRVLGDFPDYYAGKRKAPILTIFIGGNHEASSHNQELFFGGWVCPNIYYLGAANVLNVGGLRIAGLSGIYKSGDYRKPHYESLPYNSDTTRSVYHVRSYDVFKLFQVTERLDIGLSHDWPQGIENNGDTQRLLRTKPFFLSDIESGKLGSPPARSLLNKLKPKYWFSAHLHVKFAAIVRHGRELEAVERVLDSDMKSKTIGKPPTKVENPDAVDLDMSDEGETEEVQGGVSLDIDGDAVEPPPKRTKSTPSTPDLTVPCKTDVAKTPSVTYFLSLDKCLPRRSFLQILEIDTPEPPTPKSRSTLSYDSEWLAITRAFNPYLSSPATTNQYIPPLPRDPNIVREMIDTERNWVANNVKDLRIRPEWFVWTAPAIGQGGPVDWKGTGDRELTPSLCLIALY